MGKDGRKPMIEYAKAAKELNVLNWVGMEPNEEYAEISAACSNTVRIIKPFADHSVIVEQIEFAKAHGADAVSVGRGILAPLLKEGKDGVIKKVERMNEEISELMIYAGIKDTNSFDPSVLYIG